MAFEVLAIGDSIMWGQGNREGSKFVRLVCDWLGERREGVRTNLIAHSGAIANATPGEAAASPWGEIPEAAPFVHAQCDSGAVGSIGSRSTSPTS